MSECADFRFEKTTIGKVWMSGLVKRWLRSLWSEKSECTICFKVPTLYKDFVTKECGEYKHIRVNDLIMRVSLSECTDFRVRRERMGKCGCHGREKLMVEFGVGKE